MAKMTFKRDWDFDQGNKPLLLNDLTQDDQVRQALIGAIGVAGKGADGVNGRGVTSILRTTGNGAPATTDIYTITYSDATTATFSVYNGADGNGGTAADASYSNAASGLTAVNAQQAIDEVEARVDTEAGRTRVLLLEVGQTAANVPGGTPVGTLIFKKA